MNCKEHCGLCVATTGWDALWSCEALLFRDLVVVSPLDVFEISYMRTCYEIEHVLSFVNPSRLSIDSVCLSIKDVLIP